MELKRFYAEDMSHGLRTVKAEMGADAVILGSTRIDDQLEIVAAIDYDEALYEELTGSFGRGNELPVSRSNPSPVASDVANLEFRQELNELKATLQNELAQLSEYRKQKEVLPTENKRKTATPVKAIRNRLDALGLSRDISREIGLTFPPSLETMPEWQDIFDAVGNMLAIGEDEILSDGGIVALVGSTGVGKTTTVAKLAAQYTYRHGKDKVALITTDTFRIGGQEQLAIFGRALGVPVSSASTSRELSLRIREYANYDLVLIDTAGISQRDIGLADHLQSISGGSANIQCHLVISSTSELALTQEVINAFHKIPLKGAIVTKIDEAVTLGPVLSGLIRHKLPVSYLCNGQDIPRDIATANKNDLLGVMRKLLELSRRRKAKRAESLPSAAGVA